MCVEFEYSLGVWCCIMQYIRNTIQQIHFATTRERERKT